MGARPCARRSRRALGARQTAEAASLTLYGALAPHGGAPWQAESSSHGDEVAKLADAACVDYAAHLLGADRRAMVGGLISVHIKTVGTRAYAYAYACT